jgi:hypothetical protein
MTETDLMPNPVVGDSERDAGKSKKRNGLWKPNTEPPPNRNSLPCDVLDVWWPTDSGRFVSWVRKLKKPKIIICSPF